MDNALSQLRRKLGLVVVVLLLVGAVGSAGAAHPPSEQFVVELHHDGSATIILLLSFDLTTGSEETTFHRLQTNESLRTHLGRTFQRRMQTIASRAANVTDRSMTVSNASVSFETHNQTRGVVRLSIEWQHLAKQTDDQLRVTEPFASGFTPDRRFVVRAPAGYTIAEATPAPTNETGTRAVWASGTNLDGFDVVAAPTTTEQATATTTPALSPSPTPTPTSIAEQPTEETPVHEGTATDAPGFGIMAVLVAIALLAAGLSTTRYRRKPEP